MYGGMSDLRQMRGWHPGLLWGLDNPGPPPEARGHILPHSGGLWRYWCEVTPGDRAASAASSYDSLCGQVRTCMEPRSEVCRCHLWGQLLFNFVKGNCVNILRRNHWSKQNLHTHFELAKKNTNTTKHFFLLSYKIKYGVMVIPFNRKECYRVVFGTLEVPKEKAFLLGAHLVIYQ